MNQWKCGQCGELNDADVDFCFGCGTYANTTSDASGRTKNRPPANLGAPVSDPLFGNLFWNSEEKSWKGVYPPEAELPFALTIDAPHGKDAAIPEILRARMQHVIRLLSELPKRAAKALLPTFAEWNAGEDPITEEEFIGRISPNTIWIKDDGSADVWFSDDEEMFGGHWLVTTIEQDGTIEEFRLEG